MQVILSNREFKQAMSCWLTAQGFDVSKYDIDVKITVGRGENAGTKAEITLTETGVTDAVEDSIETEEESRFIPVLISSETENTTNAVPASGVARSLFDRAD